MKLKRGVDARFLSYRLWQIIPMVESIYRYHLQNWDYELVITSGMDGEHKLGSKHYTGEAIDVRIWGIRPEMLQEIRKDIKTAVGSDFDVIIERNHIHIEFDPK